ncbi:MAG: hypothetical protein ABIH77_05765 [Pseudomonadota bacterium]
MKALLFKLKSTISYLTLRERIFLFAVLVMIVFFLWFLIIWRPFQKQRVSNNAHLLPLKQEVSLLQKELKQSQEHLSQVSSTTSVPQKELLQEKQKQLRQLLSKMSENLVPTNKMIEVLKDLLDGDRRLTFLSLHKLPEQTLAGFGEDFKAYKHGIEIKFRGDYFSTLNYLKEIEQSKWHFFMDQLTYQVTTYPYAEITMRVHTLTVGEGWLHV